MSRNCQDIDIGFEDDSEPLFGDWTGISRGDGAVFLTPPIGVRCLACAVPIVEGDAGVLISTDPRDPAESRAVFEGKMLVLRASPVHRECYLLGTVGHLWGVCACTAYAGCDSPRGAALELARRMEHNPPSPDAALVAGALEYVDRWRKRR